MIRKDGNAPAVRALVVPVNLWMHHLSRRLAEQHPSHPFRKHIPLQSVHQDDLDLWPGGKVKDVLAVQPGRPGVMNSVSDKEIPGFGKRRRQAEGGRTVKIKD